MTDLHGGPRRDRATSTRNFAMRGFTYDDGLRDHLLAACGGQNNYGLAMGHALDNHRCGVWGPVSRADRRLNEFVLGRWADGSPSGRWVVSRHQVAGVSVEVATDVETGE